MQTQTKIVGTTFHPLPKDRYVKVRQTYEFEGIPCADVDALLVPEPGNQHDPEAVMVLVSLDDGEAFHIGYLPRESELKKQVSGGNISRTASIMIKNFALNNPHYSPSWIITEVPSL